MHDCFLVAFVILLLFTVIPVVTLSFNQSAYSVLESDSSATVCLELSGACVPTLSPIWVNLTTSDLTATGKIILAIWINSLCNA